MIFLDTNILKSVSLRGADAELLRVLREAKAERAATSETVLVELAAQEAIRYQEKLQAARVALEALSKASPWKKQAHEVAAGGADDARGYWRAQYEKVVDHIKPSIEVYEEALFREANVLPPCKVVGKKDKTGARDAAIWLTAVEYARAHPNETIRFVSADTDFRRVTETGRSLLEDLEDMQDRFFLYTTLGDVLTEFAQSVPVTEEQVSAMLGSGANLGILYQQAIRAYVSGLSVTSFQRLRRTTLRAEGFPSAAIRVSLADVVDARAYEIAGHTWYTADARWAVAGQFPAPGEKWFLAHSWRTRVMVSEAPESGVVTVLTSGDFQEAELGDIERLSEHFPELTNRLLDNESHLAHISRTEFAKAYADEIFKREHAPYGEILGPMGFVNPFGPDFHDVPRDMPEADDFDTDVYEREIEES